jgi:hypothetical protein
MQFVRRLVSVSAKVRTTLATPKKSAAAPAAPKVLDQEELRRVSGGTDGTTSPVKGW